MIKVPVNELKGYLDSVFSAEDSQKIYRFYRDKLILGKNDTAEKAKAGFQRKKYESSTSRQLKHITYLVDDYGSDAVVSAYRLFNDKLEHGEIDNPTIQYFAGFVKNEAIRLSKQKNEITKNSVVTTEKTDEIKQKVVPVPFKFVEAMNEDNKIIDWDFTCPKCKTVIQGWTKECPECKSVFDWDSVDSSKLS